MTDRRVPIRTTALCAAVLVAAMLVATPALALGRFAARDAKASSASPQVSALAVRALAADDSPSTAPTLPASPATGTLNVSVPASDPAYDPADIYKVAVPSGHILTLDLSGPDGSDFDTYLYRTAADYADWPTAGSSETSSGEHFTFTTPPGFGGTYYLSIEAFEASVTAGTYTVTYSIVPAAGGGLPFTTSIYTLNTTSTILYGSSAYLVGEVDVMTGGEGGVGLPSRTVRIERWNPAAMLWQLVSTVRSGLDGVFAAPVSGVTATTAYRARYIPASADVGVYLGSSGVTQTVIRKAYLTAPTASTYRQARNRAFGVWGYIKPRHTVGTYPVAIRCYRYERVGSVYKWVLRKTVKGKASNYSTYSKYSGTVVLPYTGTWRLYAYTPADSLHIATTSGYRVVAVR